MANRMPSNTKASDRKKIVMARDVKGKRGGGKGVSSKPAARKGKRMSLFMMSGK